MFPSQTTQLIALINVPEDDEFTVQLARHLHQALQGPGYGAPLARLWSRDQVVAGGNVNEMMASQIDCADIVVLMVSDHFLQSEWVEPAIARIPDVVPVLLYPVNLPPELKALKPLAISKSPYPAQALSTVGLGIIQALADRQHRAAMGVISPRRERPAPVIAPARPSTGERGASSDNNAFDIAIVCATQDELEKVQETRKGKWKQIPAAQNDPSSYEETEYNTKRGKRLRVVSAASTQMGMPAAAVLATKMILRFKPKLVAMVGSAGGAQSEDQKYGDVLVPNRTFDYNAGKLTMRDGELRFEPDFAPIPISARLHGRLVSWTKEGPEEKGRKELDAISNGWRVPKQRTRIKMYVGPVGSGAAVIDAKQPVLDIREHWRKLIGIEMEAYAVHFACQNARQPHPEFLCMKSISDFAVGKNDEWRDYALYTAAELCYRFLIEEWEEVFPEPATPR